MKNDNTIINITVPPNINLDGTITKNIFLSGSSNYETFLLSVARAIVTH